MSTVQSTKSVCEFPNCGRKIIGRGLCNGHFQQRRLGKVLKPLYDAQRPKGSLPRIICDEAPCPRADLEGPCHIFRGGKSTNGYGVIQWEGRSVRVHRYIWIAANGPVPDGLEIDHQCRVRPCCNIDHLRLVTRQVNCTENAIGAYWQINAAKTHCPQGHEYTEANTKRYRGFRYCRTCGRERYKKRS